MRSFFVAVFVISLLAINLLISGGAAEAAAPWQGTVTASGLNVRSAPNTSSAVVNVLTYGETVIVQATVEGELVNGNSTWYQIGPGQYVYGTYVTSATGGATGFGGGERWIDVDLTSQVARAMVGNTPVYAADVTVGRAGWNTPAGTFSIVHRVENETMDSETIGIPRESPDGYYYTGVMYTQYFLWTGQAFHYNYWVPDEAFGNWDSSRGCLGLRLADAKFFWDFADIGTRVEIHY